MKPSFGSAYLDDNKTLIQHNTLITLHSFHVINWGYGVGHYLKKIIINIRAIKNISGLVNVTVTSPAGLVKFFLNVEPWVRYSLIHWYLRAIFELGWLFDTFDNNFGV